MEIILLLTVETPLLQVTIQSDLFIYNLVIYFLLISFSEAKTGRRRA